VTTIPFVDPIDDASWGVAEHVAPLVRRVIARNPSKFTYRGTGTYILGTRDVVVVDPGPRKWSHRRALARALRGTNVVGIVVTHCHTDHSPLAAWLRARTGAPTWAIGPHGHVPEPDDPDLPRESVDTDFAPSSPVTDGETFCDTGEYALTAVATPGHTSNHLCIAMTTAGSDRSDLFTGDHVMGWSTTVVSPPDGDMADYIASLRKVRERDDAVLWPTHGGPVRNPGPFLDAYIEHRLERERQILAELAIGPRTIADMVAVLYAAVDPALHKPAARSVWSHLLKLVAEGAVIADPPEAGLSARYELAR
jgi:glyoxylase-like metal-dependent hydrolase (beta-lactamase superfamily II)